MSYEKAVKGATKIKVRTPLRLMILTAQLSDTYSPCSSHRQSQNIFSPSSMGLEQANPQSPTSFVRYSCACATLPGPSPSKPSLSYIYSCARVPPMRRSSSSPPRHAASWASTRTPTFRRRGATSDTIAITCYSASRRMRRRIAITCEMARAGSGD